MQDLSPTATRFAMCEHAAFAVRKCPFLAQLAKEHGEDYALNIAIEPTKPVAEPRPQGTDAVVAYAESFRLFHGPEGVLPLNKGSNGSISASGSRSGCPYHARAEGASSTVEVQAASRAVPFATISLSNFGKGPNFGDFLRKQLNKGKPQRPNSGQQQRPQRPGPSSSNAGKAPHGPGTTGSSGTIGSSTSSGSNLKPQRPLGDPGASSAGTGTGRTLPSSSGSHSKPPGAPSSTYSSSHSTLGSASTSSSASAPSSWSSTSSSSGSVRGPSPFQQQRLGSGNSSSNTGRGHSGSGADSKGGKHSSGSSSSKPGGGVVNNSSSTALGAPGCPLRKWLGPMAGLVFNQYDKLICPPAIVAARAALAKTAAVQQLRPQALPVKLVAVAAVVAGVNIPAGAVREHFEKFSVGWFVAVHATIPFVAMLRKAVIMPKYAMLVTIAAAVIGQVLGSRMERMRLQYEQQHGPRMPLQLALPVALPAIKPSQQSAIEAGRQSGPGSQLLADEKGSKSSSSAGQQRKDRGSSKGTHWREQLAADPGPAADDALGARCGSGFAAGLFSRMPAAVKA